MANYYDKDNPDRHIVAATPEPRELTPENKAHVDEAAKNIKDSLRKTAPRKKWCLPATCEVCKRTCTKFWGETGDSWACEGHYIIMRCNADSWSLPKDENGEVEKEALEKWVARYKEGKEWLKANPAPEASPLCGTCGEEARGQDNGTFFCSEHWPMEEK